MLARIMLFLFAVSVAAVSVGHSQSTGSLPEPCRAQRLGDLAALEKRKERLEQAIARARDKAGTGKDEDKARSLSKSQEELLDVLFQIDCVQAKQELAAASIDAVPAPKPAPPSVAAPAPGASPGSEAKSDTKPSSGSTRSIRKLAAPKPSSGNDAVEITTYFATNRGRTTDREPSKAYDAKVAKLTYGRAVVSIELSRAPCFPWQCRLRPRPEPVPSSSYQNGV